MTKKRCEVFLKVLLSLLEPNYEFSNTEDTIFFECEEYGNNL